MNVRKAQKHMQRATDLLNQSQLGFGTGDVEPGVQTRGQKRQIDELEKRDIKRKMRKSRCIKGEFKTQIQPVCYMYAVYNLLLRRLLNDPALNSLESVKRANQQMLSGGLLRVGRHTLEPKAVFLYDDLKTYWGWRRLWDITPNRSDYEAYFYNGSM